MGGRGEGGHFRSKRLAFCWVLNPWKKSKNSSEFVSGGFPKCVVDRLEALQVWACLVKLYCLACQAVQLCQHCLVQLCCLAIIAFNQCLVQPSQSCVLPSTNITPRCFLFLQEKKHLIRGSKANELMIKRCPEFSFVRSWEMCAYILIVIHHFFRFCQGVFLAAVARPPSCGDARWPIGAHAIPAYAKGY